MGALVGRAGRRPQFAKPCHISSQVIWPTVRGGPPATAVRFGNRLAPSIGLHLTDQKGFRVGPYAQGHGPWIIYYRLNAIS